MLGPSGGRLSTSTGCTFDPLEAWRDTIGSGRVVDPPLPVIVDLGSLLPPGPGRSNNQAPTITMGGLLLTG